MARCCFSRRSFRGIRRSTARRERAHLTRNVASDLVSVLIKMGRKEEVMQLRKEYDVGMPRHEMGMWCVLTLLLLPYLLLVFLLYCVFWGIRLARRACHTVGDDDAVRLRAQGAGSIY